MASNIDSTVARVLDQNHVDHDDEDALFAALENEEEGNDHTLAALREQRLQQLHSEFVRAKSLRANDHGTYVEIKDEKQIIDITTNTKLCIVHFKKTDFNRCRIMDEKLGVLAEKHVETRFISIDVDNAPFLVTKLGIRILPCVMAFIDGVGADRILGFEGVGLRTDTITAVGLEDRLLKSGVLTRQRMTDDDDHGVTRRRQKEAEASDADDDWD